ncbi:MAG: type II toxin-antitoxin system ParD family antitoxin [Pseudomonadales bacterium]|nr:type II toxin-antitoxin system ParD family antitoxin [Pseudomonadales bacterium]
MPNTQQLNITLPNEMAAMVREKVASGEYANDSEVIVDGLEFLRERDRGLERWLRTDVVAACNELDADPGSALSVSQVRQYLADERKKRAEP